jgi:hypothetical protein
LKIAREVTKILLKNSENEKKVIIDREIIRLNLIMFDKSNIFTKYEIKKNGSVKVNKISAFLKSITLLT